MSLLDIALNTNRIRASIFILTRRYMTARPNSLLATSTEGNVGSSVRYADRQTEESAMQIHAYLLCTLTVSSMEHKSLFTCMYIYL